MKKTRKLIPALAMLLVSAVMMSTASFAWFSINKNVEATGMKVTATTSKNLVIATGSGEFKFDANVNDNTATALWPASVNCGTNEALSTKTFYTNTDGENILADGNEADDNKAKFYAVSTDGKYEGKTCYKKYDFTIKSSVETEQFTSLYVKEVKATGTATKEISKAIRVAVTATNGNTSYTYIFSPNGGAYFTNGSISSLSGTEATYAAQTLSTAGKTCALGAVDGATGVSVSVYVWYEGQDTACTSANSLSLEELEISVLFEAVE